MAVTRYKKKATKVALELLISEFWNAAEIVIH